MVKDYQNALPQPVKDCLNTNPELKALGLKYGIDDKTDPNVIEKKVIAYVTLHYLTVHKWLGNLNAEWKAAKYFQTGYDGASYAHNILNITPEDIRKIISLQ